MTGKTAPTGTMERTHAMIHRHITNRWRRMLDRTRHYVMHNILHADDPPHRLAMGIAIGLFTTFTPTVGVQMVLTAFLAWLLRANKVVGLPIVWLSNPATLIPIYYSCYTLGRKMLGQASVGRQWWNEWAEPPEGWWPTIVFYWEKCAEIAAPLWLGGIVIGLAVAIPGYYIALLSIRSYRMKRWGQLMPPEPDQSA